MLITYTSIVPMTQAGFLIANTVNLAYLYCYILKLVSAIFFINFLFFHQMIALEKL